MAYSPCSPGDYALTESTYYEMTDIDCYVVQNPVALWTQGTVSAYDQTNYIETNTLANAIQICNQDPGCEYVLDHGCDHSVFHEDKAFGVMKVSDTHVQDNNGNLYSEGQIWRVVTSSVLTDLSMFPDTLWNDATRTACVLKKPLDIGKSQNFPAASAYVVFERTCRSMA